MRRVCFVDDAPEILKHLQRILAPMQSEWAMEFFPPPRARWPLWERPPVMSSFQT